MWWGASNRVRVYLGRELALVQTGDGAVSQFELPADASMAENLATLEPAIPKKSRLEIHLSAGLCPAVEVPYPAGLRSLREKEIFARSVCAEHLGSTMDAVCAEVDSFQPQLAAGIPTPVWDGIVAWAESNEFRLSSVRPLWAIATESPLASAASVLVLEEPDSVTLIGSNGHGQSQRAMSLPLTTPGQASAVLHRMHQALGLAATQPCKLRFGLAAQPQLTGAPACWLGHWESA